MMIRVLPYDLTYPNIHIPFPYACCQRLMVQVNLLFILGVVEL